jgi:hypothetical protein
MRDAETIIILFCLGTLYLMYSNYVEARQDVVRRQKAEKRRRDVYIGLPYRKYSGR